MLERLGETFLALVDGGRMIIELNATHDPSLRSWVTSANIGGTDFPIQNLPFAVFRRAGGFEEFRGGVAIGDQILDLRAAYRRNLFPPAVRTILAACCEPTLNRCMALGPEASSNLRRWLSDALREGSPVSAHLQSDLVPQAQAEFALPAEIGDYTDFYTSIHHATAVGRLFRPDNPLLPNYRWVPIAYHGRSSSIGISEQDFRRPAGQTMPVGSQRPVVGSSQRLDFELEVGIFIGAGNVSGTSIPVRDAEGHVFGLCLLNDWSARDLQGWEYQPLGPFLGKNFATTLSPWIVTLEALAPFRLPFLRAPSDPQPLSYLDDTDMRWSGVLDIQLEVALQTSRMRIAGLAAQTLAVSNFRHAYWTIAQMIAHHTVNGCNLRPGDLLGSGTMSGAAPNEAGSLLELTAGGTQPITLVSGETRKFLEDGDRVLLRGFCEREGQVRIGFGAAAGTVLPSGTPS